MNVEAQRWSCFAGCGYGDIYELVKLAEGIDSFPECRDLADKRFGSDHVRPQRSGRGGSSSKRGKRKAWM